MIWQQVLLLKDGATVHEQTVLNWLDEDSHTVGPRNVDSIRHIGNITGVDELKDNPEEIFEACREIRSIRRKILDQVGTAVVRDYLDSEYHHEMIDYMTIDKFACKIGKTEEPNYQITEERVLDMYISGAFPYRHVIVDEGQDFGREEIEEANLLQTIHDAVIDNDEVEGTFYVFYDRLQLIQASRIPKYISEADCKLTLYKNCRNTENIAITSLKPISQRTPKLYDGAIKGVPARIHFREDSQEAIERIETLIDELKNEGITDVVILTCKSEFKSILKENSDNGTFKKKVFTTCRKFKGLEADAIILIDVDEDTFGSEAVQRFYVGASRARLRLEIVTTMTDENCEKVLREVVDYKKKIKNAKRELALAFNAMPIIE